MSDTRTGGPEAGDRIELRTATIETVRRALSPLRSAFGFEWTDPEWEAGLHTLEVDRVIAAFDAEEPVGSAGAVTFRLIVPGGEVGAAGITMVGVSPSHRRRGILRRLMRRQLDDVHERGEPVAVLWASEGAIYRRFGYGLATLRGTFEVDRTRTAFADSTPAEGRIRLVDGEEAVRLLPIPYDKVRSITPGAISRTEDWWRWEFVSDAEWRRQGASPKFFGLYEVGGEPEGYAYYRVREAWDERGPKSELLVREVIAATPRAERDIWRWLFDIDLVGRIHADRVPVPPPLFHLLAEPRRLGLTVLDGLWLRIVDLPVALVGRRYAAGGDLVIEVDDAFCPWNAGRWRIETAGPVTADPAGPMGEARVTRTDAAPDLGLDAAALGSVYLGGIPFRDLAAAGRVAELRPGTVRHADALFAADRTPWCSTMF